MYGKVVLIHYGNEDKVSIWDIVYISTYIKLNNWIGLNKGYSTGDQVRLYSRYSV